MKYLAFGKKKFYLIPFLFIVNTIEVILTFKSFSVPIELEILNYKAVAAYSLILTMAAVLLMRFAETYKNGYHFYNVSIGILSAMLFNGLFVHFVIIAFFELIPPGFYTWLFAIVPFSIYLFIKELKPVIKRKQIIISILLGPPVYWSISGLVMFLMMKIAN